jgi:hypothetical protein
MMREAGARAAGILILVAAPYVLSAAPPLHWSVGIEPTELSGHQRLLVGVRIEIKEPISQAVDAAIELKDSDGKVWRSFSRIPRESTQWLFVLPGEYLLSVRLQHKLVSKKLHVSGLRSDPLPGLWDGLPRVEFIQADGHEPDDWFLPDVESRLNLRVETRRRIDISVLVNITPGDSYLSDPGAAFRRNMSAVIPAFRVLSQLDVRNGRLETAFLDLSRRQDTVLSEWDEMRRFLKAGNAGVVDVKALAGQSTIRNFFVQRIADRTKDPDRVVIVLSGPAFFDRQERAPALQLDRREPAPHVFYIRYRQIPRWIVEPRPRPRPGARPVRRTFPGLPQDDLEHSVDAPGARVFDVITPEQFRRVLKAMIDQISRM